MCHGRTKQLSTSERDQIIGLRKANLSWAKIGRVLGVAPSTAKRVWDKFNETGSVKDRPRSGNPGKAFNDRGSRLLTRTVKKYRFKSL